MVKIQISGDVNIPEREITLEQAGQIIVFLGRSNGDTTLFAQPVSDSSKPSLVQSSPIVVSTSAYNVIQESNAKTSAQKITAVVYFLSQGGSSVSLSDVLFQLKKMGEVPGNFSRDVKAAVDLQYILRTDSKKNLFTITNRGQRAVESRFLNEPNETKSKARGGTFKKSTPPRGEVSKLVIVGTLEGFPEFNGLVKSDAILWTILYAFKNGIEDGLTSKEVELITSRLQNLVSVRDFHSLNKKNRNNGYLAVAGDKFQIQKKGIDHLLQISGQITQSVEEIGDGKSS